MRESARSSPGWLGSENFARKVSDLWFCPFLVAAVRPLRARGTWLDGARERPSNHLVPASKLERDRAGKGQQGSFGRSPCATCVATCMSVRRLGGRRWTQRSRLQCYACMSYGSCRTEHDCSAWSCAVSVSSGVCLWLWGAAGAFGTFMDAVSRCVLAVYTS